MLEHLLGEDETVRPDMGLFLEQTWRLRPEVNAYISETFYEGRLEPAPVNVDALDRGRERRPLPAGSAFGAPDGGARRGEGRRR